MEAKTHGSLIVSVYDTTGKVIEKARIRLESHEGKERAARELKFDARRGLYVGEQIEPGRYVLHADADGLVGDQRELQVDPAGTQAVVVLGPKGAPILYRGTVKVPFEPRRELIGLALHEADAERTTAQVAAAARRLTLETVELAPQIRRQHVLVLRAPAKAGDAEIARIQAELTAIAGVQAVGSVVRIDKESVSFLTRELIVKFRSHVTLDAIPAFAKEHGLAQLRRLPQAGNAFVFVLPTPATYALLEAAARVAASELIEYAEPNLFSTAVDDAITPADFLFPMQWHLGIVHCPDAWQVLHDNIAATSQYGSAALTIAVVDSGVQTTNPDFTGTVSNGNPKVYQAFDFTNMVANNNARPSGHGTCCAGIATALADNAAPVMGQNEGVAGAAGNCRLMGIRRPTGVETDYSDMYVWVGGFDPASSRVGFPAAISPGADVITNSFGMSVGFPISGLMKDTFDLLTTYGRGGRGVLLFFSAGNANMDFTLQRPWAAYTRTFAVAASTLANDGVTEVRAPYSNFGGAGIIDFAAPSDSQLGDPYDPPRTQGTVTATDTTSFDFPADAPSHWTTQTTLSAAGAVTDTSVTVAGSAGFAVNGVIVVGTPGTMGAEFGMITAIPDGTHLSVTALKNPHAIGAPVFSGPANSLTNFGGTSSATPLAAGIGALVLTMRPSLTWIQVRDLLRSTAVKIDAANVNPTGIWTDVNGVASNQMGYLGPFYSRWYGSGRLDALAAVSAALALGATADVVVRDNLMDVGVVPAAGVYWESPDIWVRDASPAMEGGAALPANYATEGPHQTALAGQNNYLYVRVKNIGPNPTSNFFVRAYIAHWHGLEFIYPTNFIPTNHPGQPLPAPMTPGTYLIGEVQHGALAAGAVDIVNMQWAQAAIPPQSVIVNGNPVTWHPCLLVEISPQDGPTPSGAHVWENNNLAQKNISISYADADSGFASVLVLGNLASREAVAEIVLDRRDWAKGTRLFIEVLDPKIRAELQRVIEHPTPDRQDEDVILLEATEVLLEPARSHPSGAEAQRVVTLPRHARLRLLTSAQEREQTASGISPGYYRGREVFWLADEVRRIPLRLGRGTVVPIVIGGVIDRPGPGRQVLGVTQLDTEGRVSGAAAVEVRARKPE